LRSFPGAVAVNGGHAVVAVENPRLSTSSTKTGLGMLLKMAWYFFRTSQGHLQLLALGDVQGFPWRPRCGRLASNGRVRTIQWTWCRPGCPPVLLAVVGLAVAKVFSTGQFSCTCCRAPCRRGSRNHREWARTCPRTPGCSAGGEIAVLDRDQAGHPLEQVLVLVALAPQLGLRVCRFHPPCWLMASASWPISRPGLWDGGHPLVIAPAMRRVPSINLRTGRLTNQQHGTRK
jgi:hypothetical protein